MPQSLIPSPSTGLAGASSRADRLLGRQVATIDRGKTLAMVDLEARAQVEATRVHAVGYVGQQALHAAAMVSQVEGQLAAIVPLATGRLQALADMTAFAIAQVVGDAARKLS